MVAPLIGGLTVDEEKGFSRDELIVYKLGRIETVLTELKDNTKETIKDLETRLSKLEKLKYWGMGAMAVIGVVASFLKDFLFK